MNNEAITIQDCIDMFEKRDRVTIINAGQVVKFVKETRERRKSLGQA